MNELTKVVVVGYGRSPMCKARKGSLAHSHPIVWGTQVLKKTVERVSGLDPADIYDIVVGSAISSYEVGMNIGRLMSIEAGFPNSVCAQEVNRFCSSGLQAIATGASIIATGEGSIVVAGGIESMSLTYGKDESAYHYKPLYDHPQNPYIPVGITAENVVRHYNISRADMDQMAVESHTKAYLAQQSGELNQAIIPVTVPGPDGNEMIVQLDEGIRPDTNREKLAALKPCFLENGTVTAATSSQVTDGVSFLVLMSEEEAERRGIKPLARYLGFNVGGCSPLEMGLGPIYAVPKLMKRLGLSVEDMDTIELNEAFASQALACIRELNFPQEKVNPWGGAMALGHPMGATGGFLTCKALDYLKLHHGRFGLVTMCIGGGMGAACVFENLQ